MYAIITNRGPLVSDSRPQDGFSGGVASLSVPISRPDEAFVIFVGIDAKSALFDNADLKGMSKSEDAELFELIKEGLRHLIPCVRICATIHGASVRQRLSSPCKIQRRRFIANRRWRRSM